MDFQQLCIRCGECFKICPGPVLHPAGFENGLANLWTPIVVPAFAGCHQDCNFCTLVCPTGAIRIAGHSPRQLAEFLGERGTFTWDGNYYALNLTERLGVDPLEFRKENRLHEGECSFLGNPAADSLGFEQVLETLRPVYQGYLADAQTFSRCRAWMRS